MKHDRPDIPQVEKLMCRPEISAWEACISRPLTVQVVRKELESIRQNWQQTKTVVSESEIVARIVASCERQYRNRPIPVINCSGILIHTNLGRAPIDPEIWHATEAANTGYVSLEYDMESGSRGQRNALITPLFSLLTGGESAVVVNNNAAALFLILSEYAKGREVLVSRGELVQIGGGFRIPEILKQSGAKLVEVGTTNVTTCEDYRRAVTEQTAMILKVHRSNFAIRGFSEEPTTKELTEALGNQIMVVVDQGSGVLNHPLPGERTVSEHISDGAHLVTFSGDKVLGSVQAGCIVGKQHLVQPLIHAPLYRVLRPGKTILTLLEQSLIHMLNGTAPSPIRMANRPIQELRDFGQSIIARLPSSQCSLVESPMTLGGGSSPDEYLPGIAIRLTLDFPAQQVVRMLRAMTPPIIAKVEKGAVLLHLGAVNKREETALKESLARLLGV